MKKLSYSTLIALISTLLCLTTLAMAGEDVEQPTGEHWTTAPEGEKRAFLLGMAAVIDVEREAQGAKPSASIRKNSVVYEFALGLEGYSIPSAQQAIDAWYAANPDQITRPVLEVIWFEMTLPNLSSN